MNSIMNMAVSRKTAVKGHRGEETPGYKIRLSHQIK
jgi:hypothetical protein